MTNNKISWLLHKITVNKLGIFFRFKKENNKTNVLFLTVNDEISRAQIFPFFYYKNAIRNKFSLEIKELPLSIFLTKKHNYITEHVDIVAFQTHFDVNTTFLDDIIKKIKLTWPSAKIVYLDWFAPTDLRFADFLNDKISAYVKKNLLVSRADYKKPTIGDTNLTDYYAKHFEINLPSVLFDVPDTFWGKLHIGTNFAFSDYIIDSFNRGFPNENKKTIDLNARLTTAGTHWYQKMRLECLLKVSELSLIMNVVTEGRIPRHLYLKELLNSKMCFSPFGYGEVCWRDFEAIFSGSLLLKQDMSHLECYPQIYIPYETYIPLKWDLSDLTEKATYYLNNREERQRITRNAFYKIKNYLQEEVFLENVESLLELIKIDEGK